MMPTENSLKPERDQVLDFIKKEVDADGDKQKVYLCASDSIIFYTFSIKDTVYFTTQRENETDLTGRYPIYWKGMKPDVEYPILARIYSPFSGEYRKFSITMFDYNRLGKDECYILYNYNMAQDSDFPNLNIYKTHPELMSLEGLFIFSHKSKSIRDYERIITHKDMKMSFE
ncbi:MAG: hypothetical protein IBJ09_01435 [Bacteroidia bacterium]|nr:hypothetical protein [Bacteroidia bacterium]